MIWRHATHKDNLPSIRAGGLLKAFSTGRQDSVWLHCPERTPWAILHVCRRHNWDWRDVVIIEVETEDLRLLATNSPGVKWVKADIGPDRFSAFLNIDDILEETRL